LEPQKNVPILPGRTIPVVTLLQRTHTCVYRGRSLSRGFVTPTFCWILITSV